MCTATNATVSPPRKRCTSRTQLGAGLRTSRVESCRPPMTVSDARAQAMIPPARATYHHVCELTASAYGRLGQLPRVVVCGACAVVLAALVALVAFDVTGVAAVAGVPVDVMVAGALAAGDGVGLAAATVPAMPTNETMLSPPSSQRVAAAG